MKVFDDAATRDALPFERLVPALRARFAQGATVPPRQVLAVGDLSSLVMPAWAPDAGRYGVKVVNVAPGNAARGLSGVQGAYLLFDAATGVPLALLDGGELTARRTAAVSALAASLLARADARRLVVVGGGRIAALLPEAMRGVRTIEDVTVWARDPRQAEALAAAWRASGRHASVRARTDLEAAVRAADIVSCATPSTQPLVRGAWLAPGTHLDLLGSYTPAMREADDACFAGASVFVDTDEALAKSGDLLGPIAAGVFAAHDLRGTLAQLSRGEVRGRRSPEERTVFKSVGTALADLAAAMLAADEV